MPAAKFVALHRENKTVRMRPNNPVVQDFDLRASLLIDGIDVGGGAVLEEVFPRLGTSDAGFIRRAICLM